MSLPLRKDVDVRATGFAGTETVAACALEFDGAATVGGFGEVMDDSITLGCGSRFS